ncbi:MAG TPA: TetR/AcrR family transcriptional regulator [Chloroflexia bacterium]|nr:TetR/AcrR family transcriptional regulator [Chloroflexia bacterium]
MAKVIDKQSAIVNAALKLLVENGFHNTPMSLIAREAGVSAGIIYHYFENKEDLINQIYLEIDAQLSQALLGDKLDNLEGLELLRQAWLDLYAFYVAHPVEALFLEQYKNSPFYKLDESESEEKWKPLIQKVVQAIAEGKITDLPFDVLYNLTFGVAMSLAKQQIAGATALDDKTLQKVADAVCRSVRAG